jgi:inosine/xanthosine triphosphatase
VVVVASTNPVKLRAAARGFAAMFPAAAINVRSQPVPACAAAQPHGDDETRRGACGRALAAQRLAPQANYWVGIEGGVTDLGDAMTAYAWVAVRGERQTGQARTGTFFLPAAVADLVRQGLELGVADDRVFGRTDSKRDCGAVGLLTGGAIDREALYQQAVSLALIPFKSQALYEARSSTDETSGDRRL